MSICGGQASKYSDYFQVKRKIFSLEEFIIKHNKNIYWDDTNI